MGLLSKRTSTAVLALSLVLSACGTGTESSSSERTRNNALGASSCVSATGSGQQSTSTAQANVDKLAKTLASKKKAFNKAQKAFAKERKRKPAPRKPLLKTLYKKTKTTGNAWRRAELNHSLALRGLASKLASQNCTPAQVVQTVSNGIAQAGPAPTVVPELSSGSVAKDGLESSTPSEVTTTTIASTSTVAAPSPTSTAVAPTSTAVAPTTSTSTTTSIAPTTTTEAPKSTTSTTLAPLQTFSEGWLYDYGMFAQVAVSADGGTTALLDLSELIVKTRAPYATYRHGVDYGLAIAVSADGQRIGVSTSSGKLILSDDKGATMYPALAMPNGAPAVSFAITNNTDCFGMYAATIDGLFSGLFCPSKGALVGKWRNISTTLYFEVKSSADGQYAIALPLATDQAIVTKNYGSTWTKVGGTAYFASSWMSTTGQNILVSEDGRMTVSRDYGTTWNVLLNDATYTPGYYYGIAASDDLSVIYAAERDQTVLRRSTDGGVTWLNWKVDESYFDQLDYMNIVIASSANADFAVLIATYEFIPAYAFYNLANA